MTTFHPSASVRRVAIGRACHRRLIGFVLALLLPVALAGARESDVVASATAGTDYRRGKDANGDPLPESYIFAEGHFMEAPIRDGSLQRVNFTDIAKALAVNLARQKYFPATDPKTAQLLIIVHWGTTSIYDDPLKEQNVQALNDALSEYNSTRADKGFADPSALNTALADRESSQNSTMGAINRNAMLLGYARSLEKERLKMMPSTEEITMSGELNEERYFVVLMAYDYQLRLKEHKSKPLWVTRLSVRAPGHNFTEALPAMARVGAEVFGRQMDDLVRMKPSERSGTVKLGETQFSDEPIANKPPAQSGK